jgi:hypothetical protein
MLLKEVSFFTASWQVKKSRFIILIQEENDKSMEWCHRTFTKKKKSG